MQIFLYAFADKSGTTFPSTASVMLVVGSADCCPTFMNKPYKICNCGEIFETELQMYRKSIPVGLQKTDEKSSYDLELRICLQCSTTFAIRILKLKLNIPKDFFDKEE